MAYIIAHGTVNGYNKVYQPTNCGSEIQVITDIRAEFDNTSTMLEKPMGYLLQISQNGVWISVVKLLFDGERSSGYGQGFFAFSAYIPCQQIVAGAVLKQTLDYLMTKYLKMLSKEYFTQNIGIDWSFVEQASKELDAQCKHRTKTINTNYTPSDEFAYINIGNDEQVAKYLDKPFQPEYGAFKAVFIGSQLQNPNRQSTHTQLSLDLENEVYDVIWIGNTQDFPYLPKTVRKNEIDTLCLNFPKKHYENKEILLSEGVVDDVNATVTVHVPQLDPISYSLKFIINHPEAVKSITATSNTSKKQLVSTDNDTLEFIGEQVEMQWHIAILTNENFQPKELDIVPFDNIENGYGISLVEIQLIKVQILYNGQIDTGNQRQKIKFFNKQTYTSERGEYNNASNSIYFRIPITEDFESIYSISLQDNVKDYELSTDGISIPDSGLIVVTIKKRTNSQVSHQESTKNLRIYVPKQYANSSISYSYNGKSYNLINGSTPQQCIVYEISVPQYLHRNEIKFNIKGKTLKARIANEDHVTIDIQGFDSIWDTLAYRLGKYKQLILISVITLLLFVLLACVSLFTLDSLGYIEIYDLLGKNDTIVVSTETSDAVASDYETASYPTHSPAYLELNQVLEDQKDAWNQEIIYNVVVKYAGVDGQKALELKANDSLAFVRLEQLAWLWRTRDMVNKQKWNKLPDLVKKNNNTYKNKWIFYVDEEKISFLRELLIASNVNARGIFEKKIKADPAFINRKYSEIVVIWKQCKQEAATQARSSSSTNTDGSSANSNGNGTTTNSKNEGNINWED